MSHLFRHCRSLPRESIPISFDIASFVHSHATVARGQVISDIPGAVCVPGRLGQHQALGWVVDVYYMHGVLIVVFTVLAGADALIVGWMQLEDYMAGMAEDAGYAVRSLGRQNGFDFGYEVFEVEDGAGPHVLKMARCGPGRPGPRKGPSIRLTAIVNHSSASFSFLPSRRWRPSASVLDCCRSEVAPWRRGTLDVALRL